MAGNQRLRRDRKRKRLKNLLSRTEKIALMQTVWVLDRMWFDPDFQLPGGYEFPEEVLPQEFGSPHTIYPWELETLVAEILRVQRNVGRRQGNAKSWRLISSIVDCLRKIEDAEYAIGGQEDIFREISRIGYRQFRWQSGNWQGAEYVRWWSIFREENLANAFERITGITVKKFMAIGIVWNNILNTNWLCQEIRNVDVQGISLDDVTAVVSRLTAPIADLEQASRVVALEAGSTAYRRGVLRATPVIELERPNGNMFSRPIEMLLKWRLSSGLYYDVIGDQEVRDENLIGSAFENYACDLLAAKFGDRQVSGELSYGKPGHPKKTPDVIVANEDVIQLVLECKAIKLPLGVQITINDIPERDRVINDLAKGVTQVCEFEESLREGISDLNLIYSDNMMSLVVTLDDWLFMGHDIKSEIKARALGMLEESGNHGAAQRVECVVLCTSDELEKLVTVFSAEGVVEALRISLTEEHRDSALGAAMTQILDGRLDQPRSPLAGKLEEFLQF